ncbi:hypothetical protein DBX26_20175 [Vibrio sp. dhg]|nr:hypothetical protein DBX26_20175 [Vibrio sp. dhg]
MLKTSRPESLFVFSQETYQRSQRLNDLSRLTSWVNQNQKLRTEKCQRKVKIIKPRQAKLITRDLDASVFTKVKVLYLKDKKEQWFTDSYPNYNCNWMDILLISD